MSPIIGDFVSGQSNVTYTRMRMLLAESGGGLQEGVVGATDLKGQQRAAGANMSIEALPGVGWVTIDTGTRNGIGHGFVDATQNPAVTASNGTNPRIDQLVMRWNDTAIPTGTGGNVPTIDVITGTATASATLDNRTGAAALPNDCLRLADILVPATSTSVVTANIRDRRPWARGAAWFGQRSTGDTALMSATNWTEIDTTNLKARIECAGVPLRVRLAGTGTATIAGSHTFGFSLDGDLLGAAGVTPRARWMSVAAGTNYPVELSWVITPAAGTHLLSAIERAASGNFSFYAGGGSGSALDFSVEEIVRPNANNGVT